MSGSILVTFDYVAEWIIVLVFYSSSIYWMKSKIQTVQFEAFDHLLYT